MKRSTFTGSQILAVLKQAEAGTSVSHQNSGWPWLRDVYFLDPQEMGGYRMTRLTPGCCSRQHCPVEIWAAPKPSGDMMIWIQLRH